MENFNCPICEQAELVPDELNRFYCPACGYMPDKEILRCTACGQENALSQSHCTKCGAPLSTFRQVMDRHTGEQAPLWLKQIRAQASEIKAREMKASETRAQRFQELDRIRIEAEHKAIEEQKLRDQQTIRIAAWSVLAVVVLVTVLLIALDIV